MLYSTLFDWQRKIVDKFKDRDSYGLFLDMGLGKTILSLAFAEVNMCSKVLVITLNAKTLEDQSVSGSWADWASKSKLNYQIHQKHFSIDKATDADCFIVNYESLTSRSRDKRLNGQLKPAIKDFLMSCKGHNVALIIDESHKVAALKSKQTRAVNAIQKTLFVKAKKCYTYLLTGTPFSTGYVNLYSQLKILGYTATKATFVENFCITGNVPGLLGWQQPIVGYKNLDRLFETVHRFALTVESEDVAQLPDKVFIKHVSPFSFDFSMLTKETTTGEQILKCIKQHNLKLDEDTKKRYSIEDSAKYRKSVHNNPFFRNIDFPSVDCLAETSGTFWMRARQLSIGFNGNAEKYIWYDQRRLDDLKTLLDTSPDNYVLFYNYTPELLEIYDICEQLDYNIDVYCGEIKSLTFYEKYAAQSEAEQLTNKKNIILANFASGSTGMNWQKYHHCIIFSIPVFAHWAQAIKRVHRLGQKYPVFYHIFSQNNWLDKGMTKALEEAQEYNTEMFKADLARVQDLIQL